VLIDKTASLAENNRRGGHTTASRSMSRGIVRTRPLRILSPNDVDQIHISSLDVLDQIGIKIYSERALNILNDAGADVDFRAGVAKIPSHLVQEALDKCKRPVRLSGRNPKYDFTLDEDHVHLCTDGSGIGVLDLETGQRRASTKKDVDGSKNVVRVAGEKVKQILATHKVEPLSRALQDDLARIIHEGEEAIPR